MQVISGNQRMLTNVVAGLGLLLAILLLVSEVSLAAAPRTTWTNSNGNDQWSDAANWTDGVPVSGDTVIFDLDSVTGPSTPPSNKNINISLSGLFFKGDLRAFSNQIAGASIVMQPSSEIKAVSDGGGTFHSDIIFNGRGAIRTSSTAGIMANERIHHGPDSLYLSAYGSSLQSYESDFVGKGNVVISGSSGLGGIVSFGDGVSVPGKTYVRYDGDLLTEDSSLDDLILQNRGNIHTFGCTTVENFTSIDSSFEFFYIGNDHCKSLKSGLFINRGGSVKIVNSTLDMSVLPERPPAQGERIVLINNRGSEKIVGEFTNAREGSTIFADGYFFAVTYKGGTGNDMVLTRQ